VAEPTVPSPAATPGPARAVGPLELFFDLVFVFAVSQLSDHLLTHLNWRGAGETAILLVAVFSVWLTGQMRKDATCLRTDAPRLSMRGPASVMGAARLE
jgi:low temperature requirement protein LtrA